MDKALIILWVLLALTTLFVRLVQTDDETGSLAAGVFWPVYLPYRLFLVMWSGKP